VLSFFDFVFGAAAAAELCFLVLWEMHAIGACSFFDFTAKSNSCSFSAFQNRGARFWKPEVCSFLAGFLRARVPYVLYFRG
jgi:hypothetical protein